MKVVIVGNGILGLSTAFRLLKNSNCTITIIGPSDRSGAATPCAAAMLNSFAELEHKSLESEPSLSYFGMSHMATQMWPDFERELIDFAGPLLPSECAKCQVLTGGCFSKGTYVINNAMSDSLEDLNYQAIINGLKDFNENYYQVEPKDIPNYKPAQHSRALNAIYIPNEGWLNPKIVLKKLENILYKNPRVKYIDDEVDKINESLGHVHSITLKKDNTEYSGDAYLLSNGAFVTKLLENTTFGEIIQPVFSSVGVSIQLKTINENHTHVIRAPNRGGGCGIYVAPYFLGPNEDKSHVLIGASSVTTLEPRYHGRSTSVAHLLSSAISEINQDFYNSEVININVGNRPITLDQFPLLGRVEASNLLIATGTKRDGFHLAPFISELLFDEIFYKKTRPEYVIFKPTRKIIKNINKNDAVELIVDSRMNEAYQHGFRPSSIYQHEQIKNNWREIVLNLHEKIGAKDWGIPSQMFSIYREIYSDQGKFKHIIKHVGR